ncbi:hypothetical protein HMPREF1330_00010 [Enterococcus faecalis ERV129]|nr:hypothetical protein HMPREF1330_00010 [Enterococcus faecalis ERV129]EOI09781.1 hypothetical protein UCM_02878 [Enterococcus faecalis EnGen0243]
MEFMLDTINLEAIRKYQKILPLAGVTSNPSIVKQAGKIDFFAQMKEIKKRLDKRVCTSKWSVKRQKRC